MCISILSMHISGFIRQWHDTFALAAGSVFLGTIESIENWWQLTDDVTDVEIFLVKLVVTFVTKPHEPIKFVRQAFSFDDEANGIRKALR